MKYSVGAAILAGVVHLASATPIMNQEGVIRTTVGSIPEELKMENEEGANITARTPAIHGSATTYTQDGNQGSCGESHADSDMISALGHAWMNQEYKSPLCGKKIKVTNLGPGGGNPDANIRGKGNSIVVTLVDSCDGCPRARIDLSSGAWAQLTSGSAPSSANVQWDFIS